MKKSRVFTKRSASYALKVVIVCAAALLPMVASAQFPYLPGVQSDAVGGGHNGNMAAVLQALPPVAGFPSTGLYIGNEFNGISDATMQTWFNEIAAWGFQYVCPKVGGYGSTYYGTTATLHKWNTFAKTAGIKLVPFLYSIPNSTVNPNEYQLDAQHAADIAKECGIVAVDMEDEWGVNKNTSPYTYYNAQMTTFGQLFRAAAPNLPIIPTGYGNPVSNFGSVANFPNTQLAYWADAYAPQWYVGVYSQYINNPNPTGVKAAIDRGYNECVQAYGSTFPMSPSLMWYLDFSSTSKSLPAQDIHTEQTYARKFGGPETWWEFTSMNATTAGQILGYAFFAGTASTPGTPISLSATTVQGGGTVTGTVALDGPAPPAGVTVTLATSRPDAASVPATVKVPSGTATATFTITTSAVTTPTPATISATLNGVTKTAGLTVTAPTGPSLTVSPAALVSGGSATGTVTVAQAAGPDGITSTLASDNAAATVPATVFIAPGATSTSFVVTTTPQPAPATAHITATVNGQAAPAATLTLSPLALTNFYVTPGEVNGGQAANGTVVVGNAVPLPGGLSVDVSSDNPAATVPSTVVIPQGQTQVDFTVGTTPRAQPATANLSVTFNGASRSTPFVVDVVQGDVDLNGVFDFNDVTLALDIAAGLAPATEDQWTLADVNGDASVGMDDAVMLLRQLEGW